MQIARINTKGSLMDFDIIVALDTRGKERAICLAPCPVLGRDGRRTRGPQFERMPLQRDRIGVVEALETQARHKTPWSDKI